MIAGNSIPLHAWTQTTLSEFCGQRGQSIEPSKNPDSKFELYSVPSFPTGQPEVVLGKAIGSNKQLVTSNSVLLCKINPRINRAWVVGDFSRHTKIASTEWIVFPPDERVAPKFLSYFLQQNAVRDFLASNVSGVGGSLMRVKPSTLRDFPFAYPERDEQCSIVAEIEKQFSRLDEAVASLKRVKANLKRYKASVLKAAVEGKLTEDWRKAHPDTEPASKLLERILAERRAKWKGRGKYQEPYTPGSRSLPDLPNGWTWARWEQIGFSQNGRAFPSSQYQPSGFKLLRPGNLHASGKVVWTEENTRCMPKKWVDEFPEFVVGPCELVMNLTAQSLKDEFLGRVCLTGAGEACLLNQRQARLTPVLVVPEFLLWLFKSSIFRRFVDGLNTGSLIQHMFTSQLADFALPLPPLDEQHQIVAEVERRLSVIEELEASVEANLTRADRLRQSILSQAFSGRLVGQGTKNGPATMTAFSLAAESHADYGKDNRARR